MKTQIPTDCFNIAFNYLKDKYGYKRMGYTNNFIDKLRKARSVKERKEILSTVTDDNYIIITNPATEHDDIEVELLMQQYYYGFKVRFELQNKLMFLLNK
jgi:hypothetical protein